MDGFLSADTIFGHMDLVCVAQKMNVLPQNMLLSKYTRMHIVFLSPLQSRFTPLIRLLSSLFTQFLQVATPDVGIHHTRWLLIKSSSGTPINISRHTDPDPERLQHRRGASQGDAGEVDHLRAIDPVRDQLEPEAPGVKPRLERANQVPQVPRQGVVLVLLLRGPLVEAPQQRRNARQHQGPHQNQRRREELLLGRPSETAEAEAEEKRRCSTRERRTVTVEIVVGYRLVMVCETCVQKRVFKKNGYG